MTQDTKQSTSTTTGKTYNLHGIQFERVGNNRIRIVPQESNTSNPQQGNVPQKVEFSLGEWNQVLMGLGFDDYLDDPRGAATSS